MTSSGADEQRIRNILVGMGVGPDARPAPTPAREPRPADDSWWDRLYADTPEPARTPAPRLPDWWRDKPEHLPEPAAEQAPANPANTPPTSPNTTPPPAEPALVEKLPAPTPDREHLRPPQSLLDAWDNIRPRTRWLIRHTTAATAGWPIGLVNWASDTAAWFAAGHWTTPSAFVLYALGAGAIALHRRTRTWFWPIAWAATIPVSSITLGVLLYAPTP